MSKGIPPILTTNVMKSDIAAEKYNILSYDTNESKYESSSPKLLGKTLLIMPQYKSNNQFHIEKKNQKSQI